MSYESTVLALSPSLYLPFTETSGTTYADLSANGHTGISGGGDVAGDTDGPITGERALRLDAGGEVDFSSHTTLPTGASLTYELWVRLTGAADDSTDDAYLFINGTVGSSLDFVRSGLAQLTLGIAQGAHRANAVFSVPFIGCWHHYVVTFSGTVCTAYLDGTQVFSDTDAAWDIGAFTPTFAGILDANHGRAVFLNHLAIYPFALSAEQVAANYGAATPRQDRACFAVWLRLRHASGDSYIQQNGETIEMRAGGVDRIHLPLPTVSVTPSLLAGKDPASGVLAFCPEALLPRARADILTAPPVPTTTVDLCTQLRCGVADACTGHLLSLYANWARWLSPLFALLGTLSVAAFIEEILPMLLAEEASASTLAVWQEFKPEIQGIIGVFTGNLLPVPTSDLTSDIQKMLFCQLVCEEGTVRPTAGQINGWRDAFLAYPDWAISSLQGQLLELLTKFTPLEDWLIAAESANTSSACDDWTCP